MSHEAFAPPSFSFAHAPAGFRFGAVRAGIKPSGRPDFACAPAWKKRPRLLSLPAIAWSLRLSFVGRDHLRQSGGGVRLVAVNAGNANCATGELGIEACRTVCQAAAKEFGYLTEEIFPSSTGIIGVPLPAQKLVDALPQMSCSSARHRNTSSNLRKRSLTTDTRAKIASLEVEIGDKRSTCLELPRAPA